MAENASTSQGKGISKKIAGLPLYAWLAGGAALLAGLYFFMQSRSSSAASTSGTSSVTPANNVSGTTGYGIPVPVPYGTNTGSTTTNSTQAQSVVLGGAPGLPNSGVWATQVATETAPGESGGPNIPYGTYQLAGSPVSVKGSTYYPIVGPGGQTLYALGENVESLLPSYTSTVSNAVGSAVAQG